jgi:predicted Zn finger-like uncharacterized protein
MHIVCPNCAATYQLSAAAIGSAGRSVRCVRCRSVWHQAPITEVPPLTLTTPPVPPSEPANDATIAAFRSELSGAPPAEAAAAPIPPAAAAPPAAPPVAPPAAPPAAAEPSAAPAADAAPSALAAPAVTENGDPAGPSLDQLIETPAEAPADAPAEQPTPALSEIAIPTDAAAAAAEAEADAEAKSADIETSAARRRTKRGSSRRRLPTRSYRMPAALLALACIAAALIVWRGAVVRHAPQMASLYAAIGLPVNLRGLVFSEVRVSRDTHDGVPVLVVEGTIASVASKPVGVPRLRFALRNEAGGEVYAWTAMPGREMLEPGETLPFKSRLASPPGEGRDVTVRFFVRGDAVAGLR